MRSIAEIDRDHEGMGRACVRSSHGCTYPACECDRSKRIVPNVRGIGGLGRQGDTCAHNRDERECQLCQRHAQQLTRGVIGPVHQTKADHTPMDSSEGGKKHG